MIKGKNSYKRYHEDQDAIFQRDKALENEKRKALIKLKLSQDENHQKHLAEQMAKSKKFNEFKENIIAECNKLVAQAEELSKAIYEKFKLEGAENLTFEQVKTLMAEFAEDVAELDAEYKVLEDKCKDYKISPLAERRKPVDWLYTCLLKHSPKFLIVAPVECLNRMHVTKVEALTKEEQAEICPHLKSIGAFECENFAKENEMYFNLISPEDITLSNVEDYLKTNSMGFINLTGELKDLLFGSYSNILKRCLEKFPYIILQMNSKELDFVAENFTLAFRRAIENDPAKLNYNMFYDGFFSNPKHTAKAVFQSLSTSQLESFKPYFNRYPEIKALYEKRLAFLEARKPKQEEIFRSSEQGV